MSLIMLIILTSCDAKKEKKEEHTAFLVTNPIKKDTSITKDYVSQIHSIEHAARQKSRKSHHPDQN